MLQIYSNKNCELRQTRVRALTQINSGAKCSANTFKWETLRPNNSDFSLFHKSIETQLYLDLFFLHNSLFYIFLDNIFLHIFYWSISIIVFWFTLYFISAVNWSLCKMPFVWFVCVLYYVQMHSFTIYSKTDSFTCQYILTMFFCTFENINLNSLKNVWFWQVGITLLTCIEFIIWNNVYKFYFIEQTNL